MVTYECLEGMNIDKIFSGIKSSTIKKITSFIINLFEKDTHIL